RCWLAGCPKSIWLCLGRSDSYQSLHAEIEMGSEIAETAAQEDAPRRVRVEQTGHPAALWFIFWGEFAERCSYYGMRAILALYLTSTLHYTTGQANDIQSNFKTACYLLPLLGGFLADRYFGRYWTIVGFSIPYVAGHFILGSDSRMMMFFALA